MALITSTERRIEAAEYLFNWKPHPTQRLWLLDDSLVKVAACGRRWGKTEAEAVDAVTYAIYSVGSMQMIVSPTYDQSMLIFRTIERFLLNSIFTRNQVKITRTPYPKLQLYDSTIMARTADEDGRNLRGHSADRVIVDEAAYVKDAVIEEVISPMLADRNGQLIMISTPFGKNHFYRAFMLGSRECRAQQAECSEADRTGAGAGWPLFHNFRPHYSAFRFPSWDNPYISREYIESQRGVLTPRQFTVEYEAEFLDDQASVFPWEMIQSAAALGKMDIPSEEPWLTAGVDWARYSDYTTIVVMDASSRPSRVIAIDRFNGLPWEVQVDRAASFLERYKVNSVLTDQTSVGDPLLEQLRKRIWEHDNGMTIEGLNFTNQSKREIIDNLVIRLSSGEIAIPDDEQLIRELQYFEYELTAAGNVKMNARPGYTDDLVVALALAAWIGRNHAPLRFFTSGRKRESLR